MQCGFVRSISFVLSCLSLGLALSAAHLPSQGQVPGLEHGRHEIATITSVSDERSDAEKPEEIRSHENERRVVIAVVEIIVLDRPVEPAALFHTRLMPARRSDWLAQVHPSASPPQFTPVS